MERRPQARLRCLHILRHTHKSIFNVRMFTRQCKQVTFSTANGAVAANTAMVFTHSLTLLSMRIHCTRKYKKKKKKCFVLFFFFGNNTFLSVSLSLTAHLFVCFLNFFSGLWVIFVCAHIHRRFFRCESAVLVSNTNVSLLFS
jgi:hypothetical protein